ncbi:MAG TPA: sigma-70 family RNA polymerase sigma factor [Gemmataceae bacterium]|nr:sigma-70 family RNA polymerase sigma factor [Gemmataceae bacterium]
MPDWSAILSRDGPVVWQTAYRLLGNSADADECFQEACLAALAASGRQTVRDWRALLQRIAAARAMDRLRERYRRARHEGPGDLAAFAGSNPGPPEGATAGELAEQLRLALTRLPPQQAEAFCLHALDGWSYAEVADQLGLSVDHVGVLLHRARKQLRERLAAHLDHQPSAEAP